MSTTTAPLWDTMDAEAFGADTAGTLFDASTLARGADKYGTPDLFSTMDEPEPAPEARPMPEAAEHAPLSVLNRSGQGIRTMVVCSCGWKPAKAPERGSTMHVAYMAHRRKMGLPRVDRIDPVFGEGPWAGMTWDAWYEQHGGQDIDPYTGNAR
jgi:hypothetical protein